MSDPLRCDTCGKDIPLNAVSYSHGQGKPWYCSFDCMNGGDNVSHPAHYKWLPVEAIEITEHFNFCMGNALKYIIRADHKGKPVEDLRKALFYIKRELRNRGYEGDL